MSAWRLPNVVLSHPPRGIMGRLAGQSRCARKNFRHLPVALDELSPPVASGNRCRAWAASGASGGLGSLSGWHSVSSFPADDSVSGLEPVVALHGAKADLH